MASTKFQISTRWTGRKRTIQVYVYDNVKELRAAAHEYDEYLGNEYTSLDQVHGITSPHQSEKLIGGVWHKTDKAGLIRLYKDGLRTGIISHEATHMACSIYEDDWLEKKGLPWGDETNNEVLAYLVGDITSKIVNKLYQKGLL